MPAVSLKRFLLLGLFALGLSGCGGGVDNDPVGFVGGVPGAPRPRDYPVHGIDVSKYQGDIDWNAVAGSGVKFAWIKATEGGDHLDAKFQANWEGAKAAGVPRGAYHFVYWCRAPMEEARWFTQNVPAEAGALPPVLDVESDSESKTCRKRLEPAQTNADIKMMLRHMEQHFGKKPIIYTSVDFYQAILSQGDYSDYAMWVRSTKYHPSVKYGQQPWAFWQYQADGRIPGIAGKVDRNVFYGSPAEWDNFLASLEK
jgi:lysozyme